MAAPAPKTRSVKKPEERRAELVEAAQQLFIEIGYEDTSIEDIVRRIGVAKGTFYYYFDTKQAVLEALVDDFSVRAAQILRGIIDQPDVPALEKWSTASTALNSWKVAHKEELLAILPPLYADGNALLRYKLQSRVVDRVGPEYAKLISQGVEEGVFDTAYPDQVAVIVLGMFQMLSQTVARMLLSGEHYDDPSAHLQRWFEAVQESTERTLGAEPGSLGFIDPAVIDAWFAD